MKLSDCKTALEEAIWQLEAEGFDADAVIAAKDEIARLRCLLFEHYARCYRFGACTNLDDRDGNVTYDGDCMDCDLCASDHCDIDGWEMPEDKP